MTRPTRSLPRATRSLLPALPILALLCLVLPETVHAHGLAVWAEVADDGHAVKVEVYYSDGRPVAGAQVFVEEVTGEETTPIAEGLTGDEGRWQWTPDAPADLRIRVEAGDHHRGEARIGKQDFAADETPESGHS